MTASRPALAMVAALVLPACSADPPEEPKITCEERPDPHCVHPIDHILVPKLRTLGLEPRDATSEEICRRMAFDLVGRGPSAAERAACIGKTPGEIFDQLVATDDYVRTQRRAWGELLGYDPIVTWPNDIVDLDAVVERWARDQLTYPEFVSQVVMHPGVESLHPGDSWTTTVFSVFLGRTARADEIAAIRPLTEMWGTRSFCERGMWWTEYRRQIVAGADEATAIANADITCRNGAKPEWSINPCRCLVRDGFPGCKTTALGLPIDIPVSCVDQANMYSAVNFVRAVDYTPAADSVCPDGSVRPECQDRLLDYAMPGVFLPMVAIPLASNTVRTQIDSIAAAFLARSDLWEAAADREARRVLGWWQATFRHPDSDLPEVRTLLADLVRNGDRIKSIQRLIMTSQLYVQPADAPVIAGVDVETMPPWIAGPTKLLAGESWLETVGTAVGLVPQRCDFRWQTIGGYGTYFLDPRLIDRRPAPSLDALYYDGYSTNTITKLGGCNSEMKRPDLSNVGLAFSQDDVARGLCGYGPDVTPPGWSGDLAEGATGLVASLWNRAPRDGEIAAMVAEMQQCMSAGSTAGCEDANTAVRWLCQRMVDSVELTTY